MKTDCDTCKHNDNNWDDLPCDGCCTAHSGYEADAISRQAVLEPYKGLNDSDVIAVWLIRKNIEQQSSIKPKTGYWMQTNEFFLNQDGQFIYKFICSECKSLSYFRKSNKKAIGANVCPNCGAKMEVSE